MRKYVLLILCLLLIPMSLQAEESQKNNDQVLPIESSKLYSSEISPMASLKPINTAWNGSNNYWESYFSVASGFRFYKVYINNYSPSPIRVTIRLGNDKGRIENQYVLQAGETNSISRFDSGRFGNRTRHIRVQTTDGGPMIGEIGIRTATNWNDMGSLPPEAE